MHRAHVRRLAAVAVSALAVAGVGANFPATGSTASRLAPSYVSTAEVTPHTVKLTISPPAHPKGLAGYQIFKRHGATSPRSVESHKPRTKPDKTYTGNTAHAVTVKIHGLMTMTPYNFVVYGFDRHGRYAGTRTAAVDLVTDGLHVPGESLYLPHGTSGDVTIDRSGRRHAIALVKGSPTSRSEDETLVYATRAKGATRWHVHASKGQFADSGHGLVSLQTSTNGKRIAVLMNLCSGIYTAQTSIASRTMPAPKLLRHSDDCSATDDDAVVAKGWSQLPNGEAVIAANANDGGSAQVLTGTPGGSFIATDLPSGAQMSVRGISRDPRTGDVVIVGADASATVTWTRTPSGSWTGPATVPTVPTGDSVESLTTYGGRVYLGFIGNTAYRKETGATGTLLLTTRSPSGSWSQRMKLPDTTRHDDHLLLAVDPTTGRLHAAWTREKDSCQLTCGGLHSETRVGKIWNHAERLTHWYGDVAAGFAFTPSGHRVLAYVRS
ncbi:MAG TPA: fibronectin type III domain-containing protein [Mycobacteriales bacterium]|nr:fibronectin type III domain-containing protein [Mycobacteriales bacterium]